MQLVQCWTYETKHKMKHTNTMGTKSQDTPQAYFKSSFSSRSLLPVAGMMGDVRTQLYVRVEPMQWVGLGHRAICLIPRQPMVWEQDYVLCSFPDTSVISVWILISEYWFLKIDFWRSISKYQFPSINFQVSIFRNRFPKIDSRISISEIRFQRSISNNRFLGIAFLSIIN